MKKITIAGYYGFENVGDDAVLESMLHDLRHALDDINVTVLSNNPLATEEQYSVQSILWTDFDKVYAAIEKSDLLIIGGGGLYNCYLDYPPPNLLLESGHSYFSVFTFGLPVIAAMYNVPCMVFGVGASTSHYEAARADMSLGLSCAGAIAVRCEGTKNILMNLPHGRNLDIEVTADPVFRLINNASITLEAFLGEKSPLPKPILAVNLRNWSFYGNERDLDEAVAYCINQFIKENGGCVVFIPFDNGGAVGELSTDNSKFEKIIALLDGTVMYRHINQYLHPADASALVECCDLAIMMRLHAAVLSVKNHVPHIALVYDEKVKNILCDLGLDDLCADICHVDKEQFFNKLKTVWNDRMAVKERLELASKKVRKKAYRNIEIAIDMLSNKEKYLANRYNKRVVDYIYNRFSRDFREVVRLRARMPSLLKHLINNALYKEAADSLALAAEAEHTSSEMAYLSAIALQGTGNYESALINYDRALELGFSEFWVRYNRAALYMTTGNNVEALSDLKKANELDPGNSDVMKLLAQLGSLEDTK